MTANLEPPNSHRLLDPIYATAIIRKHYAPQLEVADEIIRFGADLLLRCVQSADGTPPTIALISVLFRHVVASLDACRICLESGNIHGAMLQSRAVLDGSFQMDWILQKGEKEWGNRLIAHSWRQNRSWCRRLIPGTPEYEADESVRAMLTPNARSKSPQAVAEAKEGEAAITELLDSPEFRETNQEFESWYQRRGREADQWFKAKDKGPMSIRDLAVGVGREAEYNVMFKSGSAYSHGSYAMSHVKFAGALMTLEPVRTIEGFAEPFTNSIFTALNVYVKMMERFRPEERERWKDTYLTWRGRLFNLPAIKVETNYG